MEFLEQLEAKILEVNKALRKYLEEKDNPQATIYKAMDYSLQAGGKRIRPVLMLACAEMMGAEQEKVMPFACAMEMIHTYSLIHDDLPCMDDDDLRRGKPTNHKVYGEAMAVLAGDGLLNFAYETILKYSQMSPNMTLAAMAIIAESAGVEGMIGGQVIDLESEGKAVDAITLMTMHLHKTAALIMASAKVGALLGGGGRDDLNAMEEFARYLGIAFQIKDDILDVSGSEEVLGKSIGSDKENEKSTFVSVYGLEQSEKMLTDYTQKAIEALSRYGTKAEFLINLSNFLLDRDR
ncbi:MAG: polyprenyl synthetase family protein [Clostridia bacterium]|nr:polyprenyl synthetase family protein [Clostridia bacterium]